MTNRTPQTRNPISTHVRPVLHLRSVMHNCTNDCYTEAHWSRIESDRKQAQQSAAFDYYDTLRARRAADIVAPGSICADHGCSVIHPHLDHGDYVAAYDPSYDSDRGHSARGDCECDIR